MRKPEINSNKSLPADVQIRVRRRVVQIPVEQPRVRPVVPIPTNMSKHASQVPNFWKTRGINPPFPL